MENPAKPKFKIRPRQVKKALAIALYAFVSIIMVAGMIAPGLMQ